METLPGYDAWKLATPPHYEDEDFCPECGCLLDDHMSPRDMDVRELNRAEQMGEDVVTCYECDADCRYDVER